MPFGDKRRSTYRTVDRVIRGAYSAAAAGAALRKFSKGSKSKTTRKYRTRKGMKSKMSSYNAVTMTKRRRVVRQNHSSENKAISLQVPAKTPTAMKLAMCAMEDQWFRVQGLSQYDTTQGIYPLAYRSDGVNNLLPLHVWDITSTPNWNGAAVNVNSGMGMLSVQASGNVGTYNLYSQDSNGSTVTNSQWIYENTSGGQIISSQRSSGTGIRSTPRTNR